MTAGESIVAPMQAFATGQMKKMIADIVATHDYLVFDAPPTLQSAETTVLSSQVDGVVFVVQAVHTKKEVVKKAVEAIGKGGGQVLGLVLNKNKHFIPEFIYKRV
jgi:Mrp family chromosome partitioning ATPase